MDPITILFALGGAVAAVVGFVANFSTILDYAQKKLPDRSGEKQKPPRAIVGKPGMQVTDAPSAYTALLGVLDWSRLSSETLINARGGEVVLVRLPYGNVRRLFADVAARVLVVGKRSGTIAHTEEDLIEKTGLRGREVIIIEAVNSAEVEAWLTALSRAQQARSRFKRRRLRNKFIVMFAPLGPPVEHPSAIKVREVHHAPSAPSASANFRSALVGSSNSFAFEQEYRNWANSRSSSGAYPIKESASVIRRFLQSWTDELTSAGTGGSEDVAIAAFLASVAVGLPKFPASLERAIADPFIQPLYQAELTALLLARGSEGLAGIACEIAASRLFTCIREGNRDSRERILRATPIGCGDLPPWVRRICVSAEGEIFDDVARSDLIAEVTEMLAPRGGSPTKHDFLGTNALFFGTLGGRHPIKDLQSATLLWPAFDQRSYRGFKFDQCRILQPTLADSFGPVSALCWLEPDLLAFGTFTGELRVLRTSSGEIVYAERIEQNAISGLAVSPAERTLLAVTYSGAVHRIDAAQLSRIGAPVSVGSRCRGIAFCPDYGAFLVINEAGELLSISHDLSERSVIWQSSNKTRLKSICAAGPMQVCLGLDSGELALVNLSKNAVKMVALGSSPIRCVAWSDQSASIAAVTDDGTLQMCDIDGDRKGSIQVSEDKLWSVAFLTSSHEIVVGGNAGSLRFFDERTYIQTRSADVHGSWIRCIFPDPNDDVIWSGGEDQSLCELNARSMNVESRRVGTAPRVFAIEQEADTYLVGAGDGTLYCVSADHPDEVKWTGSGHEDQIWCLNTCEELDLVLTGSDDRKLGLWRLSDGGLIGYLACGQGWIGAVCLDPSTRSALAGDDNGFLYQFDTVSRKRVLVRRLSSRRISSIVPIASGLHLAATEAGEAIALTVNAGGVQIEWTREISHSPLFCLTELDSGKIVAGGGDGALYFFDPALRSQVSRCRVSDGPVWSVSNAGNALSHDVIFCSDTGELGLASQQAHEIIYKRAAPIWTCTKTHDDHIIFGGEDGEILVVEHSSWHVRTFQLPRTFSGASFEDVTGLTNIEISVMAAAGAKFT